MSPLKRDEMDGMKMDDRVEEMSGLLVLITVL